MEQELVKKIRMKVTNEDSGHETLELEAPAAVDRIRQELAAGKWLDVQPCTVKDRYPIAGVDMFNAQENDIVNDMMFAQSVAILPGMRGG